MKFEGPPQFEPEHPTTTTDKPEKETESAQEKILDKANRSPETNQIYIEEPLGKIELKPEQELLHEETERTKEKLQNSDLNTGTEKEQSGEPIVEKWKTLQEIVVDRQYIKKAGKQLRERLRGDISIENLSVFAKQLGAEYIIETPLLRSAGGSGFTQELGDGSIVIFYHGILPGTDKYYLSHEIAHVLLGHLNDTRSGIKQGFKQE